MAMSSLLVNINIPYALGALLLAAGFYLWRAAYPRPHAGIPYDKTSARQILGDAPGLLEAATKRGQILQWVAKRCHDLNEPVIQLFLQPFQYPAVVVNDSREAYDILNHRSHEFDRSTFTSDVFEVPVPLHHVRQQMSKQWTYQRRLLSSAIGSSLFIKNVGSMLSRSGDQITDGQFPLGCFSQDQNQLTRTGRVADKEEPLSQW